MVNVMMALVQVPVLVCRIIWILHDSSCTGTQTACYTSTLNVRISLHAFRYSDIDICWKNDIQMPSPIWLLPPASCHNPQHGGRTDPHAPSRTHPSWWMLDVGCDGLLYSTVKYCKLYRIASALTWTHLSLNPSYSIQWHRDISGLLNVWNEYTNVFCSLVCWPYILFCLHKRTVDRRLPSALYSISSGSTAIVNDTPWVTFRRAGYSKYRVQCAKLTLTMHPVLEKVSWLIIRLWAAVARSVAYAGHEAFLGRRHQ